MNTNELEKTTQQAAGSLRAAVTQASQGLIERESLVETIVLAAVAGEHVLVIGPPGTAKSEAVRRVAQALGGHYFEYLLGRFTEPSEIFGPIDLQKLKSGVVEIETTGMLPEAEIAFLDEIFLGSTAILNTLLNLLNERVFRRGHTRMAVPLRICVGASNRLPEDDSLAAFADRFLIHTFVEPIPDPRLEELLEGGWSLAGQSAFQSPGQPASVADLDLLALAARKCDMGTVRGVLAHAIRRLRQAGVLLSDRRVVKAQRLVAAAAVLAGRNQPAESDVWPIVLTVPTLEQQAVARESLRELLQHSQNQALSSLVEETSQGPLARATRIARAAEHLLTIKPTTPEALNEWKLKLEGIAREIDACFLPEKLPSELIEFRQKIVLEMAPNQPGN